MSLKAISSLSLITASVVLSALLANPADAASRKKITLDAFSVWQSDAQIVQIAPKRAALVGTLGGALFIEGDDGPEASGGVACPTKIEVDLDSGKQQGQGHCTFTADDGAKVFGDWSCDGTVAEGCDGKFTITSGTGRLATIKGSSNIYFLAHEHDFDETSSGAIADNVEGITVWPELTVSIRKALASK